MRKAQKQQAEDYVILLGKAHDEIKKAIVSGKNEIAMDLLKQCQDSAIELGNRIESVEGEGVATVQKLEEYCELLFQIYEAIWHEQPTNGNKIGKSLQKALLQIENSIKNEIKVRIEAVFLPYKASMWDSLESIWKAADEDPDCDAYVIPIPYYDRGPDGSFQEMHDESSLYPDYVPVTPYKCFNFEEHRPDMIFIHNPYDNSNYVTSVHPFFYSKNLKQYTDNLVYVPYFILAEPDPDNENILKSIAHFCTVPAVMNADKVIVQSKAMRRAYIKIMTEFAGKETKKIWEEKILGLGSPKFDKMASTKKDELAIPEEWMKVIEKPDGSWKKIIFYNTSVTAILSHGEKMLEKIRDVLQILKKNQEEAALLWRPHPLMEATIKSMRPKLWDAYQGIVDTYKAEGWGIYDDTAELERAIAISDGYYGDWSSVVQMYQETGKPVMIQTMYVVSDMEYIHKPFFYDWIWDDNEIIYPLLNGNALCRTDILTGKTEVIGMAEDESEDKALLFLGIYNWNDYLILASYEARTAISFYNLKSKKWFYIPIKERIHTWLNFKEENVFEFGGYLYIFPLALIVMKVNVKQRNIEYLHYPNRKSDDDMRSEIVQIDKTIYIPTRHSNKIYKFDLKTDQMEEIAVDTGLQGIDTLCFDGKLFWMTGIGKMICSWDEVSGKCISYCDFPEGFGKFTEREGEKGFWFSYSFVYHDSIYFVPSYANMFIEFDLNNLKMKQLIIADEEETAKTIHQRGRYTVIKYQMAKRKNNRLMLLSAKNKNLIMIDLDTKKVDKIEIDMPVRSRVDKNKIVDDEAVGIRCFVNQIDQQINLRINNQKQTEGQKIYKAFCY